MNHIHKGPSTTNFGRGLLRYFPLQNLSLQLIHSRKHQQNLNQNGRSQKQCDVLLITLQISRAKMADQSTGNPHSMCV